MIELHHRFFSWRSLVQYRLRSLVIVTAVAAIPFAWWSYKDQQQRRAIATLTKSGATIEPYFRDKKRFDVLLAQKPTAEDIHALEILKPAVIYLSWIHADDAAKLKKLLDCDVVMPPVPSPEL